MVKHTLKILQQMQTEVYLGCCRTSTMELLAKIVNNSQLLTILLKILP